MSLVRQVITAAILLTMMCVHVVFLFMPPIWMIPASVLAGLAYFFVRIYLQPEEVLSIGFESIIATVVAYGLVVGLYVLLR